MGQFGGYYKGDKKKLKKMVLGKRAQELTRKQPFVIPRIEIVPKGKSAN